MILNKEILQSIHISNDTLKNIIPEVKKSIGIEKFGFKYLNKLDTLSERLEFFKEFLCCSIDTMPFFDILLDEIFKDIITQNFQQNGDVELPLEIINTIQDITKFYQKSKDIGINTLNGILEAIKSQNREYIWDNGAIGFILYSKSRIWLPYLLFLQFKKLPFHKMNPIFNYEHEADSISKDHIESVGDFFYSTVETVFESIPDKKNKSFKLLKYIYNLVINQFKKHFAELNIKTVDINIDSRIKSKKYLLKSFYFYLYWEHIAYKKIFDQKHILIEKEELLNIFGQFDIENVQIILDKLQTSLGVPWKLKINFDKITNWEECFYFAYCSSREELQLVDKAVDMINSLWDKYFKANTTKLQLIDKGLRIYTPLVDMAPNNMPVTTTFKKYIIQDPINSIKALSKHFLKFDYIVNKINWEELLYDWDKLLYPRYFVQFCEGSNDTIMKNNEKLCEKFYRIGKLHLKRLRNTHVHRNVELREYYSSSEAYKDLLKLLLFRKYFIINNKMYLSSVYAEKLLYKFFDTIFSDDIYTEWEKIEQKYQRKMFVNLNAFIQEYPQDKDVSSTEGEFEAMLFLEEKYKENCTPVYIEMFDEFDIFLKQKNLDKKKIDYTQNPDLLLLIQMFLKGVFGPVDQVDNIIENNYTLVTFYLNYLFYSSNIPYDETKKLLE